MSPCESDVEIKNEELTGSNNEHSEEISAQDKEEENPLMDLKDNMDNQNKSDEETEEYEDDDELSELEGEELEESLRKQMEGELQAINDAEEWKAAEFNQKLRYSGRAARTQQQHHQVAREAEELNKDLWVS